MWNLYGVNVTSRLIIGSSLYPSPKTLCECIKASETEIITVSLSRQMPNKKSGNDFWNTIKASKCQILPNTAGCRNVKDAVLMAKLAREIFETNWIKLELIGDDYTLQPDPILLVEATKELTKQDFKIFPYCTDDITICNKLVDLGCEVLMPGVAPIGSGQGILNHYSLQLLRDRFKDCLLIIDAGIGRPSDATQIMEMGFDGILINSAIARSFDPKQMSIAFKHSIIAGRIAHSAGIIPKTDFAIQSTPLIDTPFYTQN